MIEVTFPAAFIAGLLSFLSPCVLPLVPPYLAYLAGTSVEAAARVVPQRGVDRPLILAAVLFVLGFSTVFVAMGATASMLGGVVRQHADTLAIVAGVLIIVMGLHFLGLFRIPMMYREARLDVGRPAGLLGAYAMGLAFAFGWTPCIGPVLAGVLAVAGSEARADRGAALLAVYSFGLGVPFIAAALAIGPFGQFLGRFRRHIGAVEKVTGVALVLTGIGFLTGFMATASFWLLETFPALARLG